MWLAAAAVAAAVREVAARPREAAAAWASGKGMTGLRCDLGVCSADRDTKSQATTYCRLHT
jgi:hypothetical protein